MHELGVVFHIIKSVKNVAEENDFKEQKQQAPKDLAPGQVAEAQNEERNLGFPVAFLEGLTDVHELCHDLLEEGDTALAELFQRVPEIRGNGEEEAKDGILDPLPLAESQVLEIAVFFHIFAPLS